MFDGFEDLRVTDRFQTGDIHAFFWEGRMDGRFVAGADRLRVDDAGQVREITIVGRPLTGLAGFITGLGFHFARRRRGPVVARILRVTALPLAPMFSLVDRLVAWLIRGKRSGRSLFKKLGDVDVVVPDLELAARAVVHHGVPA